MRSTNFSRPKSWRVRPLLGELALDDDLGGDAGVVDAGKPQGGVAAHATPSGEGVLDGGALGVAEVELAGDVGRRLDDDEGRPSSVRVGSEVAAVQPLPVARLLHGAGVVGWGEALGFGRGCAHLCFIRVPMQTNKPFSFQRPEQKVHAGQIVHPEILAPQVLASPAELALSNEYDVGPMAFRHIISEHEFSLG